MIAKAKGPHGNLSRRGIRRALPTEDQGRDRLPIQSSGQGHRDNHLVRENRKDRDGKIVVYGLDHVVRIRTGETDADAI